MMSTERIIEELKLPCTVDATVMTRAELMKMLIDVRVPKKRKTTISASSASDVKKSKPDEARSTPDVQAGPGEFHST